ncbi:MAG: TlpA family protein disulfide reductase [Phycisphaerae bacterium]
MNNVGRVIAALSMTALLGFAALAQNEPPKGGKTRREIPLGGAPEPATQPTTTSAAGASDASDIGELPPAKPKKVGEKITERQVEVSGLSLKGETVIFPGDYSGKIVLVHVWGTWCPHCKEELGTWKRAYRTFKDEPFAMLGIITDANRQRTVTDAQKFVTDSKIEWTQVFDDGPQIAANLKVKSLPTILVCDGDTGEVLIRGDELRGKKLQPLLRTLIAAKTATKKNKAGGAPASQPTATPSKP